MKRAIRMDERDNVATALVGFVAGEEVEVISTKQQVSMRLTVNNALPLGHKIALENIPHGAVIYKYGAAIGKATKDITVGDHVHIHNVRSERLPFTEHMLSN